MAREHFGTGFFLVVGLVAGAATAAAQTPGVAPPGHPSAVQITTAHQALNDAIEAQRRGEYENAALLLQGAADRQALLTTVEQQELGRLLKDNGAALDARHAAAEQLRQAVAALHDKRQTDAVDLLKKVAVKEQYLTVADRQTFRQCSAGLKLPGVAPAAPPVDPAAQARSLVRQARAQLIQGDLDKADQEARDAAALKVEFAQNEDSPAKIFGDLTKAGTDPNALLKASRIALMRKDYDRAEQHARMSEKASSTWALTFWGDTPSKALKDIDVARAAARATAGTTPPARPTVVQTSAKPDAGPGVVQASNPPAVAPPAANAPAAPAKAAKNTEQARALLTQARKAIDAGDLIKARQFTEQARALKPDLLFTEDNPDKLLAEIARAEARTNPAAAAAKNKDLTPAEAKAMAVELLKKGRTQLTDGKIDDAVQTSAQLRTLPNVGWGLFEDSPEKLRQDVDAARLKQDKEESVRLLAEARRLMQQGQFDDAQRAAFLAQGKHGPYNNLWEFGDRPDKVLADLETARAKTKAAPMRPPAPAVAVNTKPVEKLPAVQPPAPPAPPANDVHVAVAKPADTAPRPAQPALPPVQPTPPPAQPVAGLPPVPGMPVGTIPTPLVGPAADPNRARADQLLAEVGRLERENKLLEAHQKALEAVQLHATFGPNEESPDYAVTHCAALGRRQISALMFHATTAINEGGPDTLKNCTQAEQDLLQARELATGFGQDGQPVEAKLAWVHQVRAIVLHQPAPTPPGPNVPGATQPGALQTPGSQPEGLAKLDQARRELSRGSTSTARKIAEAVYAGPYNLADQAADLLRSIDAEDFVQQCRQDQKTFDAANASFNRRDYDHASRLLAAIDVRRLDEGRATRWRELMQSQGMKSGPVQLASADGSGAGARETTPMAQPTPAHAPDDAAAGHARATDEPGTSLLKTTEAMRQIKFQQLRKDGLDVQSKAQEKASMGELNVAIDMLTDYLASLDKEQIDPKQVALLRAPVEKRLEKFKILKIEEDTRTADASKGQAVVKGQHDRLTAQQNKEQNVSDLMKQFNDSFKEGKYAEAETAAMKAHELDPDNSTATAAMTLAKLQMNIGLSKKNKQGKDDWNFKALADTDNFGPPVSTDRPLVVDPAIERQNQGRNKLGMYTSPTKSEKEREIERKLTMPVSALNFTDAPLRQVIDDLRAWNNVNIYIDQTALDGQGISLEHPVSVKLENISLKSALNLILKQVRLTYIIKDEVLQITTEGEAKGKMQRVTYQVADLVIPIPNSAGVLPMGNPASPVNQSPYTPTPITGPYAIGTGTPTGTPTGAPFAGDQTNGAWSKSAQTATREDQLISLITNTVDPHSWSSMGGPGTIDYHPLTMGLIVNQTPDIQEQIVDLLNSLRRLQDQEVALEVRFISISDDFFERIGVDFSLNIKTDKSTAPFEPQLVSGAFKPAGFINDFSPNRFLSGLSGPGTLTSDLDIPINAVGGPTGFLNTVPAYGGYMPGFSLGLAFLSQIQVFLFMEAVQGDNRVNVMQAPRITAFNGQTATLNVADSQTFVTNVNVTIGANGNPLFQPVITNSGSSVSLTLQPVISADRRFVRLNFGTPFGGGGAGGGGVTLTNLVPGIVNTFPVVVPVFSGSGIQDPTEQVVFTQLIQQPVTNIINIQTTVSVPDGGTVVMGGLKRLSESRSEYGPPILSKIPYINRLFKNVGYGRSAESLLIMVTPRIIIQEEEEERQTGFHLENVTGQ